MDTKAKALIHQLHLDPIEIPSSATHPLSFQICCWNQEPILHQLHNTLYQKTTHTKMTKYWVEKDRIKPHHLQLIDYNATHTSSKAMPLNIKRFSAKWACKCIGTGKNMERWKLQHVGACPYCLYPKEETRHIFLCHNVHSIT